MTFHLKRFARGVLTYAAIIAVTLALLDVVCIALGVFPPSPNYGDPDLGWRSAGGTHGMGNGRCIEFSTGETVTYRRNEDGVRTSLTRAEIEADTVRMRIAVTGDSQTELCAPNPQTHFGVLASELSTRGAKVIVLTYAAGKYSPLQGYLAYRKILRPYRPRVLILNLYTGNDFYDMLRVDDRPHFVTSDTGYRVGEPVWFSLDNPRSRYRSRVLFAARSAADKLGVRPLFLRFAWLRRLTARQHGDFPAMFAYMRDLWKGREPAVGYADAFTSQMLNQQLFFHYFPTGKAESMRRIQALMALIRGENPDLLLIMSPLPSYQLAGQQPVDSALHRTVARLPIGYQEGLDQEEEMYERLRTLAADEGWLFVDNLAALRDYRGAERLYNNFDYHLLPVGSGLIGRAQAAVLLEAIGTDRRAGPPTPRH